MEGEMLKMIATQGGIAGILFFIWYLTFKKSEQRYQEVLVTMEKTYNQLIDLLQKDGEYKEMLAGHLADIRHEIKTIKKGNAYEQPKN
jgi:hypothetical protein